MIDTRLFPPNDALILGVKSNSNNEYIMMTHYSNADRDKYLDAVFKSYNDRIQQARTQGRSAQLKEIDRLVQNIHMMHPFNDGNGRTNVYGLMNRCLLEEGFSVAILPDGPGVFGGLKTLDGLVRDMIVGMRDAAQFARR
jgi:Fic/DOC family